MRIIEINVNKQIQEIVTENDINSMSNNLIENSVNYIKLHFNFDEEWDGFNTKYVIFKNKSNKVKSLIDEDNNCMVPASVIRVPNFSFSILSENDTQRLTTNIIYIEVGKTIAIDNVGEEEELELLYKQLETMITVENSEIKELKDMISNLEVEVDLSDVTAQLNRIESVVFGIQNQLNIITSKTNYIPQINEYVVKMDDKMGNNETKADGTLFNYSYWGLVRAEEAKANTQAIIELLTDADVLVNEILEELEE